MPSSEEKKPSPSGQKVTTSTSGERVEAFIPFSFNPTPPAIEIAKLQRKLERADRALGKLDGIKSILPDATLFLHMYVRKEALLSSQIEGTQSSLPELLLFESWKTPRDPARDEQEVVNYVAAMNHGLARIQGGFPISLRLIREIHGKLMSTGRGSTKQPGEFRQSQNWIGGTRPDNALFVPPPPEQVLDLMSDLEKFIHRDTPEIPSLVKAGLIHVQFETIHPFLDGNGRLGRLLVTFLLCEQGILETPMLYLSLYFKSRRQSYYNLLQGVRDHGDWEAWLEFFLEGITETSQQAISTARACLDLFEDDKARIESLGRPTMSALRVHRLLQERPVIDIVKVAQKLQLSHPTVSKSVGHLERLGILQEMTGRRTGRKFAYKDYLDILARGTEPL